MLYSQFLTSVLYFDIMKNDFMVPEKEPVTTNTMTDLRNRKFVFATNNNCRIGLNIPSKVIDLEVFQI